MRSSSLALLFALTLPACADDAGDANDPAPGRRIDGQTAYEWGIFDELADAPEDLDKLEAELKSQVLQCAPEAVARGRTPRR